MKIDAHQHFWIYNSSEYGWIGHNMDILKRNYTPEDLCNELIKAGYSGSVAVQARQSVEETRWLLELAGKHDFIRGVVGWADLSGKDDLRRQMDDFCRNEKFVGLRHVIHDEPDDNFMLHDDFLKGISILKEYDLTFDLLLFPMHLPVAQLLVSLFPEQKFVLDHISKPLIRNNVVSPWREDITRLAQNENVWCKLSGMVTEAESKNCDHEDFKPYLDVVFEAFGAERLMIGSDWPVCRLAGEYQDVVGIVEEYISGMSDDLRTGITGENCINFYGLER
ncbi:MAG: amidohydrolase family protein [Bacteroidales bacterium]|jgi:L-fuconolactonase|nr:amidohydrolase family protein [Bacteroidales bacterium]